MENLIIEATKYTPGIEFNSLEHSLKITGKSTPENTFEFFEPIKKWIQDYFLQPQTTTIRFNVPYFNSSSSRSFYDIFDLLEEAQANSSTLTVIWEYAEENENGLETGEEFQEDFESLNITLAQI